MSHNNKKKTILAEWSYTFFMFYLFVKNTHHSNEKKRYGKYCISNFFINPSKFNQLDIRSFTS